MVALVVGLAGGSAHAGAWRLTASGGLAMLEPYTDALGPSAALAVSKRGAGPWRIFARAGYERHNAPVGLSTCTGADCPTEADGTERAWYVPLSGGVRLSSGRDSGAEEVYLELAPALVFSRFEFHLREHYGTARTVRSRRYRDAWLPGIEVAAGAVDRTLPVEVFVRGRVTVAPREHPFLYELEDERALVRVIAGIAFDLAGARTRARSLRDARRLRREAPVAAQELERAIGVGP